MEKILCAVRLKPAPAADKSIETDDSRHVLVQRKGESQKESFQYDRVFGEATQNQDVFSQFVEPLLAKAFSGYNVCVLTYGQTSSGKTHTMKGSSADPGMVPRTLNWIMKNLDAIKDAADSAHSTSNTISAKVSYVEIYNETVNDLLQHGNNNLELVADSQSKGITVKNATNCQVTSYEDAMKLL